MMSHERGIGREIVEDFCSGMAPSDIDSERNLPQGTSRNTVSGWWLDDKMRTEDESQRGGMRW